LGEGCPGASRLKPELRRLFIFLGRLFAEAILLDPPSARNDTYSQQRSPLRTSDNLVRYLVLNAFLTGQLLPSEPQAIQIAENRDGNIFSLEEGVGQDLQFFSSNRFNLRDQLVQSVEVIEIHLLSRQV
jgi:hypothetical protein